MYYKAITKTTRIPGVIKHESVQATRPIDQANLFNVFFHSVFAPPDSSSADVCLPRFNYSVKRKLSEVRLSPSNILKQLQSLDEGGVRVCGTPVLVFFFGALLR